MVHWETGRPRMNSWSDTQNTLETCWDATQRAFSTFPVAAVEFIRWHSMALGWMNMERTQASVLLRVLPLLVLLLALAGYFGPWVAHKAAALVLTGQDMAEYVKFLPEVRSGELQVMRELFYLPLLAGALGLVSLAANRRLRYLWPLRWLLPLLAVPVALSMLPPAWTPQLMLTPEFRLQAAAIAVCLIIVVIHPLLRRLPPALLEAITALLALAAAVIPVWQFLRMRAAIDGVYGRPVTLGWGLWLMPLGFGLLAVALLALAFADLSVRPITE